MKISVCQYSGCKIYPGHGKICVKPDGKVLTYFSSKCQRSADLKRNPREIRWTILYRRKHKKGQQEQQFKKKSRKAQRIQRGIAGIDLKEILARKNETVEDRKQKREMAIREIKENRRRRIVEARGTKAPHGGPQSTKLKAQKQAEKAPRPMQKGAGRKGTQR